MGYFPDPKPPKREKKKRKPLSKKRKVTGELQMFKLIWETREHVSEVSGRKLGEFDVRFFAHILSKGAEPRARLDENNIMLMTPTEHYEYDFGSTDNDPKFYKVKLKKEELKREYNNNQTSGQHISRNC